MLSAGALLVHKSECICT